MVDGNHLKPLTFSLWRDEEGAELVEWVIVVALVVIAAAIVYTGFDDTLVVTLTDIINNIGS